MASTTNHTGWELRTSGPVAAEHTVLLLPGGLCSAEFFVDLMAEPKLAGLRLVAATVPGFGRTPPPSDLSMESFAMLVGELAADLGCNLVVGHSMGANIALEMGAAREFTGPVVLLSPTFSRQDESKELGTMDRIGRVPGVGALAWRLMLKVMPRSMKDRFPPSRQDALVADMANNDPHVCRRMVRQYFEYLDRHGSLVPRLREAGVSAWVVRGDRDEIGLEDEERRGLEECPNVTMIEVADATHFVLTEQPTRTAEVVLDALPTSRKA